MKRILLVEDDPFIIDIYTTKLRDSGFSVEAAREGESALRKLNEEKFNLLLLDTVLPQIDGWEILEKIKNEKLKMKNENLKDLKIIVLSNLGQKEEVEKGLRMGATKYLIKAYHTPSEVVEEIKKIL